ncbi:hypothetical protein [Tenacibaculum sp. Ill]|uniref:hypothetical protein n=1 Tax=Tenacibaculum sp. Ill TaxID=3445935 RepID=UPI003F79680C
MRKTLYETEKLKIEHEWEDTFLINKSTNQILLKDDFYGDPDCGLIDKNNKWAVIGGDHLTIWTQKSWKRIENEDLKWIHSLKYVNDDIFRILIDPWSEKPAIWEFNLKTFDYNKIRDFNDYNGRLYQDQVTW